MTNETVEERFDRKFTNPINNTGTEGWFAGAVTKPFAQGFWKVTRPYLLDFINQELSTAKQEAKREAYERVIHAALVIGKFTKEEAKELATKFLNQGEGKI